MTGLDKMINQILDEANSSAEKILEDARIKRPVFGSKFAGFPPNRPICDRVINPTSRP